MPEVVRVASRPVLIVGEAPSARRVRGRTRDRMTELAGRPWEEWADWVNLLDVWPGRGSGNGSAFDHARARVAALAVPVSPYALVLLLGKRVARAFLGPLAAAHEPFEPFPLRGTTAAIVPHTSGVNHFWNVPEARAAAEEFLRTVAA